MHLAHHNSNHQNEDPITNTKNRRMKCLWAVVSIRDKDKDIDPHILSKLFTKFTTKSNQETGLGLYIAKSIKAHGGQIWAQNNYNEGKGKGATFSFSLPLD